MSMFGGVKLIQVTHAPGDWKSGEWVEGEKTETPFYSSWQPARGKTLELLPVGKRSREAYRCFPPIGMCFTSADDEKQVSGDIVIWEGKEYEVSAAAKWNNGLNPHWELICTRIPPKENMPEDDEAE